MAHGFYGRESELAWLRSQFETVAAGGGPRLAVVVAESGTGKSRLVQQLYLQLTADPHWDPPEVDYWPDAFRSAGDTLRVTPVMDGHEPKGPPRFIWMGGRWTPTTERNATDRRSVLPEVQEAIMDHVRLLDRHRSVWSVATKRVASAVPSTVLEESLGAVVPMSGLLTKLVLGSAEMMKERLQGPRTVGESQDISMAREVKEVLDCLKEILEGGRRVPAVLWLDDAQWMDPETEDLLEEVWERGRQKQWPLLVVATHWEREWRQAVQERSGLGRWAAEPWSESRVLQAAGAAELAAWLGEQLPGLTAAQRALLVEKAAGNWLQMDENVGGLRKNTRLFVGRDLAAPLTEAGEAFVRSFKVKREERVRQRFEQLDESSRDLLGWATRIGWRFLAEVVEEYARQELPEADAAQLLGELVDPMVVLGVRSALTREFRDKLMFAVAEAHRREMLQASEGPLGAVLRRHLRDWIDNSFDEDGGILWPGRGKDHAIRPRSVTALGLAERAELLGLASRELLAEGAAGEAGAATLVHLAKLLGETSDYERGRKLLETALERSQSWSTDDSLQAHAQYAYHLYEGGEFAASRAIYQRLLAFYPDDSVERATALSLLGFIEQELGDWRSAKVSSEQALAMLTDTGAGDAPIHLVSTLKLNLAMCLSALGLHDEARIRAQEAVAGFAQEIPESSYWWGVVWVDVGLIERAAGDLTAASRLADRAARLSEAELGGDHFEPSCAWMLQAWSCLDQGDFVRAQALIERSLAVRDRALPRGHWRTLIGLENLACLHRAQGRVARADEVMLHLAGELPAGPATSFSLEFSVRAECRIAAALWRAGERDRARERLDRALERCGQRDRPEVVSRLSAIRERMMQEVRHD